MILTISGTPGSGKSTIAKLLVKELKLKHYSTGDFMREIAQKRKIDLMELSKLAEKDIAIDREIDAYAKKLGETEDNFILDTRLGFHFIPQAIKIFLDASLDIRAHRVFKDQRPSEKAVKTIAEMKKQIQKRQDSEIKRYQKYYNLNPYDHKNFDLVVDTGHSNPEEIVKKILEFVKKQ